MIVCERGMMEARWYREHNGARFIPGLRELWVFPVGDGTYIALMSAELSCEQREENFHALMMEHWCARYGLPEARSRLRAYLRGDDVA